MKQLIKFVLVLLFPVVSYSQCLKMDIMLLGDMSASVKGKEGFIADAFDVFISRFDLSNEGMRIGIVMFNDDIIIGSGLTVEKMRLYNTTNQIRKTEPDKQTAMAYALQETFKMMTQDRFDVQKVIVLVSDGKPDSESNSLAVARKIRSMPNCSIIGILTPGGDEGVMKELSTLYMKSDYNALVGVMKQLDMCL